MKKSLLFILVVVCFIIKTNAQIIHIPSDLSTIQAGIDSASNGDTVLVAEGTYFENINFKGKAITVTSRFIMDGDTSHISKTIIDGSKSTNPDTASVVMMWSGEDTTSVLMGFTITGGTGTNNAQLSTEINVRSGGGVFIKGCGGKITNNVIEGNHVKKEGSQYYHLGGGIYAFVYNSHTVIIRNNIIKGNAVTGDKIVTGGGFEAMGGRIICEYNEITNNSLIGTWSCGGGIRGVFVDAEDRPDFRPILEDVIHEVIIRNNTISGNSSNCTDQDWDGGGGYCQYHGYEEDSILFYNNIISNNHTNAWGGGLFFDGGSRGRFFNNTIVDNSAERDANCIYLLVVSRLTLYNNILWHYGSSNNNEFWIDYLSDNTRVLLFNNIIMTQSNNIISEQQNQVTAFNNSVSEPIFQPGSCELAEGSPGIGWAIDTIQIDTAWYYAPAKDFFGNKRPDPVDQYIDAGAVESAFPKPPNANLAYIGLWDRKLWPEFNKDTLHYVLPVPDTTVVTPQLDVITEDWAAEIDINNATDISSESPEDRITTIIVKATDGTTQKIYTVLFRYASKDVILRNMSISKGALVPEFNLDSLAYTVCLPRLETITPVVTCETTDPNASFFIAYAKDIQSSYPHFRTTTITVTAEDGINQAEYIIEHSIDKYTIPSITHASDTVILPDSIEVTSNEDGYIYLVPVTTQPNLESIMAHRIDSTIVASGIIAYIDIDTAINGKYRLYAIDNCLNISSPVTVTIIGDTTGINENMISTVRLYPIPVDQTLYIETDQSISSVELFNVIGVKVMDKSKPEGRIDMGHLEQGMYFVRIKTDRGDIYTGKVIKK